MEKYLIILIAFFLGIIADKFLISNLLAKNNYDNKPRITGIGGIFFKANDPKTLKDWYADKLNLEIDEYGTNFEWREGIDSTKYGFTQWSIFKENTKYFLPSDKQFMINYRVHDLEKYIIQLKSKNVTILDSIESFEYGKFIHILDLENNKIELWEPVDTEYNKIVKARTK